MQPLTKKEKTKQEIIAWVIVLACVLICFAGCKSNEPEYVEYFKQGQLLPPDEACSDTLIVVDAEGLNKAFAPIEQGFSGQDFGDEQYDSLFHVYCIIKK